MLTAKTDYVTAKQDFDKAKELDELRFRAPEQINTIIKKLAGEYPVVHLVDTKALFEQYSPHGIIGSETILEHVHPNLFGYAIMSEAFYQAFQQQHLITDSAQKVMSFDELRKEMPITRMDSLSGQYQVMMLKTGWPFNQPIPKDFRLGDNLEDTLADKVGLNHMEWRVAMGQIYEHDKQVNNKQGALRVFEAMSLEYPQNEQFCGYAANLNALVGNYDMAAFYYKKLNTIAPSDQLTQTEVQMYLRADEPEKALSVIKDLAQNVQAQAGAAITQIISDKQILRKDPANQQASARMAANLKALGVTPMPGNNK